jgi:hypothetical protein
MTTQPEALLHRLERLGQDSVGNYGMPICAEAAAELRRLHAENERLHQINHAHEMKLSVRGYEIQIEDLRLAHAELRKVNGELLEALRRIDEMCAAPPNFSDATMQEIARAAIARAEGEPK